MNPRTPIRRPAAPLLAHRNRKPLDAAALEAFGPALGQSSGRSVSYLPSVGQLWPRLADLDIAIHGEPRVFTGRPERGPVAGGAQARRIIERETQRRRAQP